MENTRSDAYAPGALPIPHLPSMRTARPTLTLADLCRVIEAAGYSVHTRHGRIDGIDGVPFQIRLINPRGRKSRAVDQLVRFTPFGRPRVRVDMPALDSLSPSGVMVS